MGRPNRLTLALGGLAAASLCLLSAAMASEPARRAEVLPKPQARFSGRISERPEASIADWPRAPQARKGAPNVVVILLDDAGFAASSTFGGLAETPTLSRLAEEGVRYNRFHVTAVCSPTRAALLSGRNSHQVGYGGTSELASGFPGYNNNWPKSAATIAEVLKGNGYSTAAFGKWHNTPSWAVSPVGPFDRWPTGMGFESFYGFMLGETSQWEPLLWRNTTPVEPPATPGQGYHFTEDIADQAIRWVHTQETLAPDKPYFLYFAPAAPHKPHHVPAAWQERYRGRFDRGWDVLREETFVRQKRLGVVSADAVLTPRPEGLPAWNSLSSGEKRLASHEMETFAAFLAHTDHEIGRVLDAVRRAPAGENTLVIFIGTDNGASGMDGIRGNDETNGSVEPVPVQLARLAEAAGPNHLNAYSAGWAWMNNTPFQWMKLNASHLGGVRSPLVVSWPGHTARGSEMRNQFLHVTDIAPTIYEATGIKLPDVVDGARQSPLEGRSFLASLKAPDVPSRHRIQYFENWGDRSIYQDGWIAALRRRTPWASLLNAPPNTSPEAWELYNIDADFSQAHDLARANPRKLKQMIRLFDSEARRNQVYPIGLSLDQVNSGPWLSFGRTHFTFFPDVPPLSWQAAPNMARPHEIVARLNVPASGGDGVIMSRGSRLGGFVLYMQDGRLIYENSYLGRKRDLIAMTESMTPGFRVVKFEFEGQPVFAEASRRLGRGEYTGLGRLFVDGRQVAEGPIARVSNPYSGTSTLSVGRATNSPVTERFIMPFAFTGAIERVDVTLR